MVKEIIGDATLYLGDYREVLPLLPAYDVLVTDPPYKMTTSGMDGFRRGYVARIKDAGLTDGFDVDLLGVCDKWLCFCSKAQITELIGQAEKQELCWMLRTWNKTNPVPLVNRTYYPDTEYMVHAFKSHYYRGKNRYVVGPIEHSPYNHPTVKPLYVMRDALNCSTHEGDTVFDPFMGSGSTGVACMCMGRKFIGAEINPEYFEMACERIEKEWNQVKFEF